MKSAKFRQDRTARKRGKKNSERRRSHNERIISAKKKVYHPDEETAGTALINLVDHVIGRMRDKNGKLLRHE